MDHHNFEIARLMSGYLKQELTETDSVRFEQWLAESSENRQLLDRFKRSRQVKYDLDYMNALDSGAAWKKVLKKKYKSKRQTSRWKVLGYAASILFIIGITLFYWMYRPDDSVIADTQYGYKNDVLPGNERATLRLSDGRQIRLGKQANSLHEQDGTVIRERNGELAYAAEEMESTPKMLTNTLTVPKAGTFRLVLPDGTKVWVNALSTLRFPTRFGTEERRVYVTGEAYFEVAKDTKRPFRVAINSTMVEALGTAFNIRAYNRNTTTTLTEGSVKVTNGQDEVTLSPGLEARVEAGKIGVNQADVEKVVAWKEGEFYFYKDDIRNIMEEIARWYDLEVQYASNIPYKQITGNISRKASLAEICRMLTKVSKLTFEIDQKKIYVKEI